MFTILENIFKNNSGDKINSLNKSFFNKYLDQEIILKLIDIRKLYIDILTFEKSKEKDIRTRDILKKELDYYINKKNILENHNFALLKKKINIVKSLTEKIDIKKIETEEKINKYLIRNADNIGKLTLEIDRISNEINSLTINKFDKDMLVNTLKYKINNIDKIEIDYLSYNKKDKYESELKNFITNKDAIRCYMTYLFEMISLDLDNLYHTYEISKSYMLISYQKDMNINLENNSILLEYNMLKDLNNSVDNYLDIIMNNKLSNNRIREISLEKIKHNSIIHNMSHFAKNYKELHNDDEIISSEYEIIRGFILDLRNEIKTLEDEFIKKIITDTIDIFKNFSENIGVF